MRTEYLLAPSVLIEWHVSLVGVGLRVCIDNGGLLLKVGDFLEHGMLRISGFVDEIVRLLLLILDDIWSTWNGVKHSLRLHPKSTRSNGMNRFSADTARV